MKTVFLLVALVAIVCLNCDGKLTKNESLQRSISEFSLKNTPLPTAIYYPKAHVEIVTDTIMPDNTLVRIKNYSILDDQILISHATSKTIKYQRVFESEIRISKASRDILNTHISAKYFKTISDDSFWDSATLQHAWVNQELSTLNDIQLDISFINAKTDAIRLYRMTVDSNGQQTFNLIEDHS